MASIIEEKKGKDITFTPLKVKMHSSDLDADGGISFSDKVIMERRARSTVTSHGHIPSSFMRNARQNTIRRMRTQSRVPSTEPFTPRLARDNTERDPVMQETIDNNDHYTPDWFKMSIRTVDRDKVLDADPETKLVSEKVQEVCRLRDKWVYKPSNSDHVGCILRSGQISLDVNAMKSKFPKSIADQYECKFEKGIMRIISSNSNRDVFELPSFAEYQDDLQTVMNLVSFGPAKTMCYRRLKILHSRFILHQWLNDHVEVLEVKSIPHRDFYNVRKIDNHVHHSACMHQKHLLRFIKRKLKKEPETVCFKKKDGTEQTLAEVFEDIGVTGHELSIDALDMHAHQETFQRFDKFNAKYNPVGKAQLRTIFLKIDNLIQGRYLAEITKEVSRDLEESRYQFAEYRVSIYGKKKEEWDIMGDWVCNNQLYSSNVRWLIQMPRIYNVFRKIGLASVQTFADMFDNFFAPLFEVTLDPSSHPSLHLFLQMVVGFDSVDDESSPELKRRKYPDPSRWTMKENPPYTYYAYYTWVNICKLNKLREVRGMNVFSFRPHCGEAGGFDHLGSAFLLANSINHGIRLKDVPVLQYLYYLKQIGLAMSPLSNNILFEEYDSNPLPAFFKRGLNIALSTDDPLLIHYTKDALLEEYSIAAQVYNLSSIDLCELARNSVLQCGWDKRFKEHCIGRNYQTMSGAEGNNIYQSNVPDARLDFRASILQEENNFITYAGYPQDLMRKHSLNSAYYRANHPHNMTMASEIDYLNGFTPGSAILTSPGSGSEDDEDGASVANTKIQRMSTLLQNMASPELFQARNTDITKHKAALLADHMATSKGYDATKPPPHEEWVALSAEQQRLQVIRHHLTGFMQQHKESVQLLEGYGQLEKVMTEHANHVDISRPQLLLSNTSHAGISVSGPPSPERSPELNDKQSMSAMVKSQSMDPERKLSPKLGPRQTSRELEKATKKLYKENKHLTEEVVIEDIRGLYFDDTDSVNEIDKKFNVKLGGTNNNVVFAMKPKRHHHHHVTELRVDLVESKQEYVVNEECGEKLVPSDEFLILNKKHLIIECEMDTKTGELIWNSGVVWYKKDWKVLVGAWTDPDNNLIEIRPDNTLRYIDGYGPFVGEFIGFQKLHVQMPNGQFMHGNVLGIKQIKWENGEKWTKCSDKGCLIM